MTVYLVGAGPGDPGLLTVRGAEVLRRADVVVYDRLSVQSLLDLAPATAERINVGKSPGHATVPQHEIDALLVERGRTGACVVRLKGGDPFVFARGGEEATALAEAGVDYEVVPGVTSAIAVPAYAGIPLTQRHSSELFTVITGHEDPDKGGELDWEAVARLGGTIVVLMGVGRLPKIVDRLLAGGLSPDTPVAAIRWGTRPEQHTVRATLATITDHALEAPSTIVIGAVAAMELDWYESKSLFGLRVGVTRPAAQAPEMVERLWRAGAQGVVVPVIEIAGPPDGGAALGEAAAELAGGAYDWVVFTSVNGVERFCARLRDARAFGATRVAAIGPGTAEALAARNVVADLVPERFVAEGLLEVFPAAPDGGRNRVLLPRAAVARDVLVDGLRERGWEPTVVAAYETVPAQPTDDDRAQVTSLDVVTFTSSSTVTRFVETYGAVALPDVVACIGPVTAATARAAELTVDVEAEVHTVEGLIDSLARFMAAGRVA